jgi:hypothetical protein
MGEWYRRDFGRWRDVIMRPAKARNIDVALQVGARDVLNLGPAYPSYWSPSRKADPCPLYPSKAFLRSNLVQYQSSYPHFSNLDGKRFQTMLSSFLYSLAHTSFKRPNTYYISDPAHSIPTHSH